MTNQAAVIAKAKKFAQDKYDAGYDMFVECYGTPEWVAFVGDMGWKETKAAMDTVAGYWADGRADAAQYDDPATLDDYEEEDNHIGYDPDSFEQAKLRATQMAEQSGW